MTNNIDDNCVILGVGSFELYLNHRLIESRNNVSDNVKI